MDEYNRVRFDEGEAPEVGGGRNDAVELIDMLMEQEEDEKNDGGWGEKDCEA